MQLHTSCHRGGGGSLLSICWQICCLVVCCVGGIWLQMLPTILQLRNLLLPCCVCALFLDLIMADVGSLNDQRILEWSRVGRDVGAVTMSVYVVRLHPPPSTQALSWYTFMEGRVLYSVKMIIFAVKVLYFMITWNLTHISLL